MNSIRQHGLSRAFLALALAAAFAGPARAADYLLWDKDRQRVDASIQTWDVTPLLQRVAASTGWEILLEPGTKQVVPTRFRNLEEGDALRRMLGDLNFVLVPQTNNQARLYVFRTSRAEATQPIRPPEQARPSKAKAIENELVVTLKPGEKIEDLARRLGAKVVGRLDDLNTYRLRFTDAESTRQARQSLVNDPSVASVDSNYQMPRPESPDGLPLVGPRLSLLPKAPPDGKYLVVGLVDSAVQPQQGRFANFILDPISLAGQTKPPDDKPTHGTAMAETILNGLASGADQGRSTTVRILPVDVYGNNSVTSTFDVAAGIYRAIEAGARIINLSMGSEGDSSFLHDVIRSGHDQGIIFFAAAGNEPVTTPTYPAAYPETTGVTSRDRQGNIASYANRGSFVRAAGPSSAIITFEDRAFYVVGTSPSTAWISGYAAWLAETTRRPMREVETAVRSQMAAPRPPGQN